MSKVVIDKTLEFRFPDEWKYCVYEDTETRINLQRRIQSIRCIDLLLLDTENKFLYLIEAKDFNTTATRERETTEILGPMTVKVAEKYVDTLAGLLCAKMNGNEELKPFYRALWNPRIKKRLVSYIELGELRERKASALGVSMFVNLTQKMKTILKPVCCEKYFCDSRQLPIKFGWAVNRIANFQEN